MTLRIPSYRFKPLCCELLIVFNLQSEMKNQQWKTI